MIDIDEVVRAADQAYRTGASNTPAMRRDWLYAVAAALESHRPDLVSLAAEETHLAAARLEGELTRTIFQLRFLGDEAVRGVHLRATIDHADVTWGMGPRPDLRSVARPIGVVAVFGASNFPFAFSVAGGDSASALAAGCPVVHKAHPAHPVLARRTAEIVVEALRTAGAPVGWFALIDGQDEGVRLVQHPLVKAVAFTGSTAAGRALFDLASSRKEPIPFFGELGSTNPAFVTTEAWQKRSASITAGYLASVRLGRGQFCTKPGFLAVPAGAGDAIAEAARGDDDAALLLTPGLRDGFESSMEAFAALPGVEVLHGGASAQDAPPLTLLRASADTVIARPEMLEQEMFGPASVIVEYHDAAQLEQIAPLIGGQLTSTIHAEPQEDVAVLLAALSEHSGRIVWNDWPTGVSVSFAQNHGGPYPAATTGTTSVGASAIDRFQRQVAYQGVPQQLLPPEIRDENPLRVPQRVDGELVIPEKEAGR
jgi:NADP-dependent aldehyde dehydrogenase